MSARRLIALLSIAIAPAAQAQTQDLGEGFLCCNMRANGTWISESNYEEDKATVVRVGTPLKHDGFGRYRVHVLIDGKRSSIGNDQVLMAVGYPMSSENPSLDAKEWKYWLSSFAPFTVHFGTDNRVDKVEGDAATLAKVYAK